MDNVWNMEEQAIILDSFHWNKKLLVHDHFIVVPTTDHENLSESSSLIQKAKRKTPNLSSKSP